MIDLLLLVCGLVVLIVGGEGLVRGAVSIAQKLNVSTLIIGMTVVSFGTSAPELIVSIKAALDGNPDIAIGNVVGSNIANLALVLGVTVMILPMAVDRDSVRYDWPMMMLLSMLFWWFASSGAISHEEGLTLFILLMGFVGFLIWKSRKAALRPSQDAEEDDEGLKPQSWIMAIGFLLTGLIGLYFGSELLLSGAVGIAESSGMDQRTIGLTIVAFGTSVPELATSVIAARRGQTDISIGNLIGSNIFNIGAVIGITAIIKEINVAAEVLAVDMFWMIGISLALLPLMLHKRKLIRWKGILLFAAYVVYIAMLLLMK